MRRRIDDYIDSWERRGDKRAGVSSTDNCERIEEIVKLTAEVTVAEAIKALLQEIKQLRKEIELLRAEISRNRQAEPRASRSRKRGSLADKLVQLLSEEGYLFASEAKDKLGVGPYRLRELAQQTGSRVIPLEGDLAVVDPEAYREFIMLLASTNTSDPAEASRRMGRYRRLFEKLRSSSMVYYDARRGSWRLLE